MNLTKSRKIVASALLISVFGGAVAFVAAVSTSNASNDGDNNALSKEQQCLVTANEKFLDYLEQNSTTYKLEGGTIINLPDYPEVIDDARNLLKAENDNCQ